VVEVFRNIGGEITSDA